ncbi:hypothetical protein ACFFWC_26725 [Plantactinospora siamensis]|uniref:SCO6045-like C-terminal domain-containing protein n=1 Tax=Plantactinospora siamensis TaxID=555372 RepID=A0ABV6NZ39_9ACTN
MTGDPAAPAGSDPSAGSASLARRQAELAAAVTAGAPVPVGFDARLVGIARRALLGKRAGEVARHWPALAAGLAGRWPAAFVEWAADRPANGALRDGWDLARSLLAGGALPAVAAAELALRDAVWWYPGDAPPRRRWMPALRRAGGAVAVQVAGRVRLVRAGR